MADNRKDSPGKWTVLESEYIVKRPWLTARKDRVKLPDGRIHEEYYVLEYPKWINVVAVDTEGRFVMVEQYRHGIGEVLTELCAGVVEADEEPLHAAKRELAEETGYTGGEWSLLCVSSANPGAMNNLCYTYLAEGVELTSGQQLDETEDVAVRLLTRGDVARLLQSGGLRQSLMCNALFHYLCGNRLSEIAAEK